MTCPETFLVHYLRFCIQDQYYILLFLFRVLRDLSSCRALICNPLCHEIAIKISLNFTTYLQICSNVEMFWVLSMIRVNHLTSWFSWQLYPRYCHLSSWEIHFVLVQTWTCTQSLIVGSYFLMKAEISLTSCQMFAGFFSSTWPRSGMPCLFISPRSGMPCLFQVIQPILFLSISRFFRLLTWELALRWFSWTALSLFK